ncbi:MAG: class I mannose-6-phosphate isomerase [Ruminococcus sp.]|nr:class I mannose-6-phosphate isomerase [Ruminococcus sp.]
MTHLLFLKSAVKDYIWGGDRLKKLFGKESDCKSIAESWELSCNKDGSSTIINGSDAGLAINEYIEKYGAENILGRLCRSIDDVPIIKLIDAKESLSIQVHPDDEYAQSKGFPCGKSEMWYVIDAEDGAEIVYGVKKELTQEKFENHINGGTLEEILNFVPVKKGDVFYIPAGTLHAIGGGILIAEVQQNSNLTYRVYDYNRRDSEGRLRELHIEDAIGCASLVPTDIKQSCCNMDELKLPFGSTRILCVCDYFGTSLEKVDGKAIRAGSNDVYRHFLILDGEGIIEIGNKIYNIKKGDSILMPPTNIDYCIDGKIEYLSTFSLSAEDIE